MSQATEVPAEPMLTPCQTYDPDLWFAEDRYKKVQAEAIALCGVCPARLACLEGALERREPHGIFGGLTATQRAKTTLKRIA